MSAAAEKLLRLRRGLLGGGALALLAAAALAWWRPAELAPAYRLAAFACLAPALGSVLFSLIHRTTGGVWGEALAPFLAAGARLAPWVWTALGALLFFAPETRPAWPDYASRGMLALRHGFVAALLFAIAWRMGRRAPSRSGGLGPAGLIALVFALHVLAHDWLTARDPDWRSTVFPVVWMSGQAVAGLACAVGAALLAGISPEETGEGERALGLDWGNLLLAALVFWSYLAFAQFLIVWSGDLPGEIGWYLRRTGGAWAWAPLALLLGHFVAPLAVLLSRANKRSAKRLGAVAALLLAAQFLYLAWMLVPVEAPAGPGGIALRVVLTLAALALWFHRYLGGLRDVAPTP